ncbi:hypothetical protein MKEN_00315200 [Mycena kentingensis (nom. inval.)]|nr:hypothetical protein MKEN_00315200 [Mycena kentingensis (nom. inval.)]
MSSMSSCPSCTDGLAYALQTATTMPICTTCTTAVPFLYTEYSEYNLRLEQCQVCAREQRAQPVELKTHSFADSYVEHDSLTLLLDLILLKRGVFRHLLYNRDTEPRRLVKGVVVNPPVDAYKELERASLLRTIGRGLCALEALGDHSALRRTLVIRWSHLNPNQPPDESPWTTETLNALFRTLVGVLVETFAFHSGVICACFIVLSVADRIGKRSKNELSAIRREFRFSLIPLTLFYSSLTKLFLLFLLTIWRPSGDGPPLRWPFGLQIFSDEDIDREWVVRNVLGGMSAGFGLRVILDTPPIFTTLIIICGWVVKTAMSHLVSRWVGGDEQTGEAWLAYSIP